MIGDFLFKLTPRDRQVTLIEPLFARASFGNTAVIVSAEYEVPAGRVLALMNLSAAATPGAGARQSSGRFSIRATPSGEDLTVIKRWTIGGASSFASGSLAVAGVVIGVDQTVSIDWQGLLYVPEGFVIAATFVFDSLIVFNNTSLELAGYLLPRGNIAT